MANRKFVFLINPVAGTSSKKTLPGLIASMAGAYSIPFSILPTVESGDYHFVKQQIRENGVSDVIICGGDGTINTVVQSLRHTGVNFGIVPLGSGNGLALSAGIPLQSARALRVAFNGEAALVDGFHINHSFACMLCGLGFDAQVAHDFAKQESRGLLTYAGQSLKNYFRAKPYPFSVDLGKTHFSTEAYFISIANSNQFGNRITIAPKASLTDGLLDIVVVRKMNKAKLPFSLLHQIAGGNPVSSPDSLARSGIIYLQADQFTISNPALAPLHIDGDPGETEAEFRIKVIPACFRLIQPRVKGS